MLIDKFLEELTKLRQDHGPELQVMRRNISGGAHKAGLPRLAHMQKGHKQTLFREGEDPDRIKGEKVVTI